MSQKRYSISKIIKKKDKQQQTYSLKRDIPVQKNDGPVANHSPKKEKEYDGKIQDHEFRQRLIEGFLDDGEELISIRKLLLEVASQPSDTAEYFIIGFLKGFTGIRFFLKEKTSPFPDLHPLDSWMRRFLAEISGKSPPQRRALLGAVADYVNTCLDEYLLVSPEEMRQIDPKIHCVIRGKGTEIKEGISFAVVRRDTGKTVMYADVEAE